MSSWRSRRGRGYDQGVSRWILHVDMDAFYASVEQLDDPSLKGKPVIVGGLGPRGVVATASYEARAFGVHSAMPMAKARKLCPHGVFIAPRFERYQELATKIQGILSEYTPLVEPVSLDEAFLDLTGTEGLHGPPERVARELHARIPQELGLTCSVGLAQNKLLAKLASDSAKPGGLLIVKPEDVQGFLDPLPVDRLWGIGPKTARRLAAKGVCTVADLRAVDVSLLTSWFGPRTGAHLWRLARGLDDSPVAAEREAKSISQEITYPEDLYDPEEIRGQVRALALKVAGRLRAGRLVVSAACGARRAAAVDRHVVLPLPALGGGPAATDCGMGIEYSARGFYRPRFRRDGPVVGGAGRYQPVGRVVAVAGG